MFECSSSSPEERLGDYRRTGDRAIRNAVVEEHRWLAVAIAKELRRGSESFDDLLQVALLGLVKAADRFDPSFGATFASFGAVTARGEVRRHYRDAGWAVRVPRRLQELRYDVRAATDVLRERLRRSPTAAEIAEHLHVRVDEVIDAVCADDNYRSKSLDERVGDASSIGDRLGAVDANFEQLESDQAFDELTSSLPDRTRRILHLRYVDGLKQSAIASEIGVSQVHVSRLLAQAHRQLRTLLEERTRRGDSSVSCSPRACPAPAARAEESGARWNDVSPSPALAVAGG